MKRYDIDTHYQCGKCRHMNLREGHKRIERPASPFVIKEVCPRCYVETNAPRAQNFDSLARDVSEKFGLSMEEAKAIVEECMRLKSSA